MSRNNCPHIHCMRLPVPRVIRRTNRHSFGGVDQSLVKQGNPAWPDSIVPACERDTLLLPQAEIWSQASAFLRSRRYEAQFSELQKSKENMIFLCGNQDKNALVTEYEHPSSVRMTLQRLNVIV